LHTRPAGREREKKKERADRRIRQLRLYEWLAKGAWRQLATSSHLCLGFDVLGATMCGGAGGEGTVARSQLKVAAVFRVAQAFDWSFDARKLASRFSHFILPKPIIFQSESISLASGAKIAT